MPLESEPFETMRWKNPEGYTETLKELEAAKPEARPTPLPDLLIYREEPNAPKGTPKPVAERLRELREERERIAKMWHGEGKTRTWIPNTAEARKAKLQAKLHNRAEAKHAEIIKKFVQMETKPIHLPPDAVVVHAVEL